MITRKMMMQHVQHSKTKIQEIPESWFCCAVRAASSFCVLSSTVVLLGIVSELALVSGLVLGLVESDGVPSGTVLLVSLELSVVYVSSYDELVVVSSHVLVVVVSFKLSVVVGSDVETEVVGVVSSTVLELELGAR